MKVSVEENRSSQIETSVIIVSWNVRQLLKACLVSIEVHWKEKGQPIEVIVVDGGSEDGSAEMVRQEFPEVTLIAMAENVGFPKGNNIGLERAQGDYLLLLNPDTEVLDDAVNTMASFLKENPEVGIVGPRLLNPDGTQQPSRRRFPTMATALFESTWLEAWAPSKVLSHYYMTDLPDTEQTDVDWLVGACLMVRRDAVRDVGPMDEDYFMYSEELDWCRRIKDAGWRIVFLPTAEVKHHVGKSSEQAIVQRHINFQQAKLRYFRKFHGPGVAMLLRSILLANYAWQIGLEGLKGGLGHKRGLRKQRMKAYWQILRSGLRPAGY
jgi:hypothetical protein